MELLTAERFTNHNQPVKALGRMGQELVKKKYEATNCRVTSVNET